jgi:hypothetical protein
MRNFARINSYYNRIEAWKDFEHAFQQAIRQGLEQQARQLRPAEDAGWRKIDAQTRKVRALIEREKAI